MGKKTIHSLQTISKQLHVPVTTIDIIVKKYEGQRTVANLAGHGHYENTRVRMVEQRKPFKTFKTKLQG